MRTLAEVRLLCWRSGATATKPPNPGLMHECVYGEKGWYERLGYDTFTIHPEDQGAYDYWRELEAATRWMRSGR